MPCQQRLDFAFVHLFADFVTDPPCSLVRDAQLALKLFAAHPVACRDEQVDRIEPNLKRCPGVLKDCASGRIQMIATSRTSPSTAVAHAVKRAIYAASIADVALAKPDRENVLKASFVIREAFEEIADTKVRGY